MTDARERLSRLIELATQSAPEKQRALAFELCDLLLDWPQRYPPTMREPFEALLEKALRRLDGTTRRIIAARLATSAETAVALLNEFYFDMPVEARAGVLARNAEIDASLRDGEKTADETPLIEAARVTRGVDFTQAFGRCLRIPVSTAQRIVDDTTGNALAVACKGAHLRRATYSALALLTAAELRSDPSLRYSRLSSFDEIPETGAEGLLAYWRRPRENRASPELDAQMAETYPSVCTSARSRVFANRTPGNLSEA